jgi:PKD repeat protein
VSNTSGAPLIGARVAVIDGPNAGVAVLTNANGSYRFESLSIANMNFSATATDYLEARAGTFVNGTNSLNFALAPVPPPPPPPPPPVTPTITITSRLIGGNLPQEWGFTATSNVTGFTSYDWDFGDGGTSTGSRADEQHVYRQKGTFKVTVTGRRGNGDPVVGTIDITV